VIQGQLTRLSRTTHGIAYDTTNDEIIAPNPLAAAIVIFRGGATGEEPPAGRADRVVAAGNRCGRREEQRDRRW
jgi:hypothetical protein